MGKHMAGHLMRKKNPSPMMVFNRTASKADDLVAAGARFMKPAEIAREADFLFLMLGYPHDVEQMVLDKDGVLANMRPGATLIDHTSSSPDLAKLIEREAKAKGVFSVDAPVSGGDLGAQAGRCISMVGGTDEAVARALPLLDAYCFKVEHMGAAGAGHHAKLVN